MSVAAFTSQEILLPLFHFFTDRFRHRYNFNRRHPGENRQRSHLSRRHRGENRQRSHLNIPPPIEGPLRHPLSRPSPGGGTLWSCLSEDPYQMIQEEIWRGALHQHEREFFAYRRAHHTREFRNFGDALFGRHTHLIHTALSNTRNTFPSALSSAGAASCEKRGGQKVHIVMYTPNLPWQQRENSSMRSIFRQNAVCCTGSLQVLLNTSSQTSVVGSQPNHTPTDPRYGGLRFTSYV